MEGDKNLDMIDEKLRKVKMASKELDELMQALRLRYQRSILIDKKYALYRNRYILRTGEIPPILRRIMRRKRAAIIAMIALLMMEIIILITIIAKEKMKCMWKSIMRETLK